MYLIFSLCGHRKWQIKSNNSIERKLSSPPAEALHHLHPETLVIYVFPNLLLILGERLDKIGAVGGMLLPSGSRRSAGSGPPYRPLRLAGDVQARAAADKWAEILQSQCHLWVHVKPCQPPSAWDARPIFILPWNVCLGICLSVSSCGCVCVSTCISVFALLAYTGPPEASSYISRLLWGLRASFILKK